MEKTDKFSDEKEKIIKGLKKSYEKLVREKKKKGTKLILMKGDKIIRVKP